MPEATSKIWRQKPVLVLALVTFISSATVWAAVPYLPVYLNEKVAGLATDLIGVAVAASSVGMIVGHYPMARLITRISIRPIIIASFVVEGASLIGVVIAAAQGGIQALVLITAFRFIAGVARSGVGQGSLAAVRKVSTVKQRAEVYGLVGSADIAGITFGTLLSGLIAYSGISMVFVAAALACVVCAPVALALPAATTAPASDPVESAAPKTNIRANLLPLTILLLFTVSTTALIGAYNSAWGPYLRNRGASVGAVGLLFALFTLPFILLAPRFGRWATTYSRRVLLITVGSALAVAAALSYPFLTWLPIIIVIELIAAAGSAAAEPSLDALVSDISDDEGAQSRIFGIAGTVGSATSAASSITAGFLMPVNVGAPFLVTGIFAAVTLLLGAILLAVSRRVQKNGPEHAAAETSTDRSTPVSPQNT
jgi:MFS family permease